LPLLELILALRIEFTCSLLDQMEVPLDGVLQVLFEQVFLEGVQLNCELEHLMEQVLLQGLRKLLGLGVRVQFPQIG